VLNNWSKHRRSNINIDCKCN